MDDTGTVIAFWLLAVITVGSALMIVAVRNLIHAVVFMMVSFVGIAGLYLTLSADFVAVTQVLLYVGAISVLMLFAIVLTPGGSRDNAETFLRLPALALTVLLGATLAYVAIDTDWSLADRGGFTDTASAIGDALLGKYVLPFEIASVLLLAAMIGAIVLVRPEASIEEAEE
ncbi:MAG: NADH-quinone oxidoreductase subunit J [Dehalococcoidia bacterium]|nr:NADH-quinone oxidoreductase subunit J [Dehalococcoidia bacterium]